MEKWSMTMTETMKAPIATGYVMAPKKPRRRTASGILFMSAAPMPTATMAKTATAPVIWTACTGIGGSHGW